MHKIYIGGPKKELQNTQQKKHRKQQYLNSNTYVENIVKHILGKESF